ncbi:MAG: hypothetical protein VB042_05330 [Victivallaceae bacterium]|nr:hypothetical protein [Victivallaceae bacterium]
MAVSVYALRKAILRDFKNYLRAPIRAAELVEISCEPAIVADQVGAVEQVGELLAMGYLEAIPGWSGSYLQISKRGLEQLAPEFRPDAFIHGPSALA